MKGWSQPARKSQASTATLPSSAHLLTRREARKLALQKLTEKHQLEDFLEREAAGARVSASGVGSPAKPATAPAGLRVRLDRRFNMRDANAKTHDVGIGDDHVLIAHVDERYSAAESSHQISRMGGFSPSRSQETLRISAAKTAASKRAHFMQQSTFHVVQKPVHDFNLLG